MHRCLLRAWKVVAWSGQQREHSKIGFTCCIAAQQATKTVANEGYTLQGWVPANRGYNFVHKCISASVNAPVGLPTMRASETVCHLLPC